MHYTKRHAFAKRAGSERRRHKRYSPPVSFQYTSLQAPDFAPIDLSASGMRICAGREFHHGETLNIALGLHGMGYLQIEGRVVWSRREGAERSEAGVEFGKMEPRAGEIIRGYLC